MSDDLLKAATRALRDQTELDEGDGRFTRARVMASLHQGKVKRRTRLAFILPVAATLAAGTAWGAATGRLPALFHALSKVVIPKSAPRAAAPSSPPAIKTAAHAPSVTGIEATPAAELAPGVEPAPAIEPQPRRAEPHASAKAAPAAASSAAFSDSDGDLYRLAHEAHFASHDYARALQAWDAYLQAAPRGRFAVEARYNRAICLLRLGRESEARQALEPFAAGTLGYRRSEAQQLLDELSK